MKATKNKDIRKFFGVQKDNKSIEKAFKKVDEDRKNFKLRKMRKYIYP